LEQDERSLQQALAGTYRLSLRLELQSSYGMGCRPSIANGAAEKPQALTADVGLIRVVVQRCALRKPRMPSAAPVSPGTTG
jgi:hypothetical protein